MSANERISISASLQLILAGKTIGIGSSGNTDEIDLYGGQINFQGPAYFNNGLSIPYGGIEVGGVSAWSGIINGVSDGNGHYGDITVSNGIITGWSDWS
jgi:hypothetical protein